MTDAQVDRLTRGLEECHSPKDDANQIAREQLVEAEHLRNLFAKAIVSLYYLQNACAGCGEGNGFHLDGCEIRKAYDLAWPYAQE